MQIIILYKCKSNITSQLKSKPQIIKFQFENFLIKASSSFETESKILTLNYLKGLLRMRVAFRKIIQILKQFNNNFLMQNILKLEWLLHFIDKGEITHPLLIKDSSLLQMTHPLIYQICLQQFVNQYYTIKMGLWPWLVGHMFTPRFWKSIRFDGILQTYQRGHKAVMNNHSVGGNSALTKYVGMDQYGNKYYECFDAQHYNQRRWVQYNDYLSVRSPNGDRVPPKWHGWIHHQYDDTPLPDSDSFQDPFFQKPHQWESSSSFFRLYTSRASPINPRFLQYRKQRTNKIAGEWTPVTKRL